MPTSGDVFTEVQIPNFLVKVWNILEDDAYKDAIHWDSSGCSFHVADPLRFSKEVLPLFFKHNNLSSFVRQLNMYGFRKVTPLEKTGLSRAQSDQEHLEFQHAYFVQGHPELLQYIKRKSGNAGTGGGGRMSVEPGEEGVGKSAGAGPKGLDAVLNEMKRLRERQNDWDSKLGQLKKENTTLWRELSHMRTSHMKQQTIVNKLIQFLLQVVQQGGSQASGKRLPKRYLLAIEDEDLLPTSSKKLRTDLAGSSSASQLFSAPGASASLEAMQQELRSSQLPPASTTLGSTRGPIISDVTDEMDQTSPASFGGNVQSPPGPPMAKQEREQTHCGEKRVEWNVTPPPPTADMQDFNDFLSFMDMDLNNVRNSLNTTNAPTEAELQEAGKETQLDSDFLESLFADMPQTLSNSSSNASNPPLSLTAGPGPSKLPARAVPNKDQTAVEQQTPVEQPTTTTAANSILLYKGVPNPPPPITVTASTEPGLLSISSSTSMLGGEMKAEMMGLEAGVGVKPTFSVGAPADVFPPTAPTTSADEEGLDELEQLLAEPLATPQTSNSLSTSSSGSSGSLRSKGSGSHLNPSPAQRRNSRKKRSTSK